MPQAVLVGASLAITAIGTGLSVYSSYSAAQNERKMADYNYALAQQQAELQGRMAQRQAEIAQYNAILQQRDADLSRQMSEYNAQVSERNATTLRAYAEADEAKGREDARRMREEKARIIAIQRSQFAKSGVVMEGSPLAVLAETDATIELQLQDMWWSANNEAKKKRGQADMLDWEAKVTRHSGDYSFALSSASAEFNKANALFESEAASAGVRIAKRQSQIDRMGGYSRGSAYELQGLAAGVSGAGDMSRTLLNYDYNRNRSTTPKTSTVFARS